MKLRNQVFVFLLERERIVGKTFYSIKKGLKLRPFLLSKSRFRI